MRDLQMNTYLDYPKEGEHPSLQISAYSANPEELPSYSMTIGFGQSSSSLSSSLLQARFWMLP